MNAALAFLNGVGDERREIGSAAHRAAVSLLKTLMASHFTSSRGGTGVPRTRDAHQTTADAEPRLRNFK